MDVAESIGAFLLAVCLVLFVVAIAITLNALVVALALNTIGGFGFPPAQIIAFGIIVTLIGAPAASSSKS